MLVSEAITKAYQEAKGKPTAPASGTNKHSSLLILADTLTKIWAAEPDVEWNSLYATTTIDTIDASASFAIPSTVDYIVKRETDPIFTTDGTDRVNYGLVQPNELYRYKDEKVVAKAGSNLIFYEAFTATHPEFGFTLKAPCILKTTDITLASQTVQVDDPMWLVFMMAADFIRTDLTRQNQYDRLVTYAMEIMRKMKQNNTGQFEKVSTEWSPMGGEDL